VLLAAHAPQKHGLKERSGASSNIFANDKKKKGLRRHGIEEEPEREEAILPFEVCDASFVSLIKMLRLLTNNCSALLHLFSQRAACGSRLFAPAARRDLKKIQPKGSRRSQKRIQKSAAELIFSWVLFVRKETPCLLRPKGYTQLRSQSQFCLTKCAPPIPVLYRARRSASSKQRIHPGPRRARSARKGGPGMSCCIYFLLSA
jgi:mRNA-degrading endonuclease RelE of RelBE toxin-antitoxin system